MVREKRDELQKLNIEEDTGLVAQRKEGDKDIMGIGKDQVQKNLIMKIK